MEYLSDKYSPSHIQGEKNVRALERLFELRAFSFQQREKPDSGLRVANMKGHGEGIHQKSVAFIDITSNTDSVNAAFATTS